MAGTRKPREEGKVTWRMSGLWQAIGYAYEGKSYRRTKEVRLGLYQTRDEAVARLQRFVDAINKSAATAARRTELRKMSVGDLFSYVLQNDVPADRQQVKGQAPTKEELIDRIVAHDASNG